MRLALGFEPCDNKLYSMFIEELAGYADCVVTKNSEEILVEARGNVVELMQIVAVCDKYRNGKALRTVGG